MQVNEFGKLYNEHRKKKGLPPVTKQSIYELIKVYIEDKEAGIPYQERRGIKAQDLSMKNSRYSTWRIDEKEVKRFLS